LAKTSPAQVVYYPEHQRRPALGPSTTGRRRVAHTDLLDMEVIVRRQDQERYASITCMIRHYVARRAQVTEGHPHNADIRAARSDRASKPGEAVELR
jgi:hypothetical protein